MLRAAAVPHLRAVGNHAVRHLRSGNELILHPRPDIDMVAERPRQRRSRPSCPACRRCTPRSTSIPRRRSIDLELAQVLRLGRRAAAGRGAAALREADRRHLIEGWGMTETSPTGTFTPAQRRAQGRLVRHADAAASSSSSSTWRTRREYVAARRARRGLHHAART